MLPLDVIAGLDVTASRIGIKRLLSINRMTQINFRALRESKSKFLMRRNCTRERDNIYGGKCCELSSQHGAGFFFPLPGPTSFTSFLGDVTSDRIELRPNRVIGSLTYHSTTGTVYRWCCCFVLHSSFAMNRLI